MTVLLAAFAAALVLWIARRLGALVLDDLDHIRATLGAVADGRRDVRTGLQRSRRDRAAWAATSTP